MSESSQRARASTRSCTKAGRYYFSSQAASERFRQNRDRYVPWNGGTCPVTQLEQGLSHARRPSLGRSLCRAVVPLRQRRRSTPILRQSGSIRRRTRRKGRVIERKFSRRERLEPLEYTEPGCRIPANDLVSSHDSGIRELGYTLPASGRSLCGISSRAPSQDRKRRTFAERKAKIARNIPQKPRSATGSSPRRSCADLTRWPFVRSQGRCARLVHRRTLSGHQDTLVESR